MSEPNYNALAHNMELQLAAANDAEAEQYGWDRSIRPGLDNHIALSMVEAEVVPMDEDPPPEDNNNEGPPKNDEAPPAFAPAPVAAAIGNEAAGEPVGLGVDAPRPVEVPAPTHHDDDEEEEEEEEEGKKKKKKKKNESRYFTLQDGRIIPEENAVTNGSGSGNYDLPGNKRVRDLVKQLKPQHKALGYGLKKPFIYNLIEQLKEAQGMYFLKEGPAGDCWIEMSDLESFRKVDHMFRTIDRIANRKLKKAQAQKMPAAFRTRTRMAKRQLDQAQAAIAIHEEEMQEQDDPTEEEFMVEQNNDVDLPDAEANQHDQDTSNEPAPEENSIWISEQDFDQAQAAVAIHEEEMQEEDDPTDEEEQNNDVDLLDAEANQHDQDPSNEPAPEENSISEEDLLAVYYYNTAHGDDQNLDPIPYNNNNNNDGAAPPMALEPNDFGVDPVAV